MHKNYKTFIDALVTIAIITFLLIHFVIRSYGEGDSPWGWESISGDISYTAGFVVLIATLFNCLLWRIPLVGKWLHTPNISGSWNGKGKSSYNNTEYEFTLKISQTFLETHVHGYFEKSRSDSFSSVFIHNDTFDRTEFVYSYQNDPNLEYRNKAERGEEGALNIHYGTTKLVIDYEDLTKLSGTYWNDRNCTGSWELTKTKKNGK